jgi:hypothetical protein
MGWMIDVLRRNSIAIAVTVVLAAAALAGPSLAHAATLAKPANPGLQDRPQEQGPPPGVAEKARGKPTAGDGEGIVQSVSATTILIRELDGSAVSVPVAPITRVFVDGKLASLGHVRPGFVASAAWKAGKPAALLQAFDLSGLQAVSVGVVASISKGVLVVTGTGGTTQSIRVNAKTRVLLDGKPATLAAVKAGFTVVILAKDSKGKKPAHELRFLRPR